MFIQHCLPPLGFIAGKTYSDSMALIGSQNYGTTTLSPAFGHSVQSFVNGKVRFWSPLYSPQYNLDISVPQLKSPRCYAKSVPNSYMFKVIVLNF